MSEENDIKAIVEKHENFLNDLAMETGLSAKRLTNIINQSVGKAVDDEFNQKKGGP